MGKIYLGAQVYMIQMLHAIFHLDADQASNCFKLSSPVCLQTQMELRLQEHSFQHRAPFSVSQ